MSHPKGMRAWTRPVDTGAQVHVYSDDNQIILQLRRTIPTDEDALTPSFKVAVTLSPSDALALAAELIGVSGKMVAARDPRTSVRVIEDGDTAE